jgi:hypothetical protein
MLHTLNGPLQGRALASLSAMTAGAALKTGVLDGLCVDAAVRRRLRPLLDLCTDLSKKAGRGK